MAGEPGGAPTVLPRGWVHPNCGLSEVTAGLGDRLHRVVEKRIPDAPSPMRKVKFTYRTN